MVAAGPRIPLPRSSPRSRQMSNFSRKNNRMTQNREVFGDYYENPTPNFDVIPLLFFIFYLTVLGHFLRLARSHIHPLLTVSGVSGKPEPASLRSQTMPLTSQTNSVTLSYITRAPASTHGPPACSNTASRSLNPTCLLALIPPDHLLRFLDPPLTCTVAPKPPSH